MKINEPYDTIKQWGIKSISARVIDEITNEAHALKLTNGQMIERLWEAWKSGGTSPGASLGPSLGVSDDAARGLTALLAAAGPWTEHNPLPAEARRFINAYARLARENARGSAGGVSAAPAPRLAEPTT